MPSKFSSEESVTDALKLAQNLGIKHYTLPIHEPVSTMLKYANSSFDEFIHKYLMQITAVDTTEDNIQARLRGFFVMGVANKFEMLMLATSNKDELSLSQSTLYGDLAGALAPIGDISKLDVYALAKQINIDKEVIPSNVLTKPASAELAPGQSDEVKFGKWADVTPLLKLYIEEQKSEEEIAKILNLAPSYVRRTISAHFKSGEHKRRQSPIVLKMSSKAFGPGRRMPVNSYFRPTYEGDSIQASRDEVYGCDRYFLLRKHWQKYRK